MLEVENSFYDDIHDISVAMDAMDVVEGDQATLERRTEELKQIMYETINTHYHDYLRNCQPTSDTQHQLELLKTQVDSLPDSTQRLSSPINLEAEVTSLGLLLQLHNKLQGFDNLLDVGELFNAASSIVDMMDTLEQLADMLGVTCDKVIFDMLKGEFLAKKARLKHRLDQLFCTAITTIKKNHQSEISVSFRILSTHAKKYVENPVALEDVLCGMYMMDLLEPKLRDLSRVLMTNFVDVILADAKAELNVTRTKLHATLKLHSSALGKKTQDLQSVWKNLVQFAQFISTCMLPGEAQSVSGHPVPYVSVLANVWWPEMWQKLLQCIKPIVPDDKQQLGNFYDAHGHDLVELNTQLQSLGVIPRHATELSDFVMNVEKTFVKKQRNELLFAARDVLVADDPNTVEVTHATERGGLTSVDGKEGKDAKGKEDGKGTSVGLEAFHLPTMHVSERVRTVVEMAYQTLQEAVKQQEQDAIELFYCTRDLFDLTRAVLPAVHGNDLDHAPGPALVFYNDCTYISHHLLTLAHQFRLQLPEPLPQLATFVDMVPAFRKMGEAALKRQLHRQRDALLLSVSSCAGFGNVQEDIRFEQVEQSVKQIVFQLTSLAKTWKPLGPQEMYRNMMGTLVDGILQQIEAGLLALDSMTPQDSYNLRYMLSLLPPQVERWLETTRGVGKARVSERAPIPKHIKSWESFLEVLQVLQMQTASQWKDERSRIRASAALHVGRVRFKE